MTVRDFERKGRWRLDVLQREDYDTFLQVVVGLGAMSSLGDSMITGYGCLITVGTMSDEAWRGMVLAAERAAAECREEQSCFVLVPRPG